MKIIAGVTLVIWIAISIALVAAGNSPLVILFLGFGALIFVMQAIPCFMLLSSLIKGVSLQPAKERIPREN